MLKGKPNLYQLLIVLIFILALGLRGYRVQGKDALFMDENLSIVLSNYGTYGYAWPAVAANDEVKFYEGRALKDRIFKDDSSFKNILYDLWNLRKSTRDTPHTNLYYSCLRMSFWGADTADLNDVVGRAFMLNLLAFSIGFFFLFRLSRILFRDNWLLILLVLGLASLNPISISNTIFMREYQFQETMFIVLTYLIIACVQRVNDTNKLFGGIVDVLGLITGTAIALLPGYFGVPYIFMMWGGLLLYVLVKNNGQKLKMIIQLSGVFVGAVMLLFLIYPAYLGGFSGDKGEQAVGMLSPISFFNELGNTVNALATAGGIEVILGLAVFFVVGIVLAIFRKSKFELRQWCTLYIIICAIVWAVFTFYLAPVKEIRYIASIFPLLYLIFPFALSLFSSKVIQQVGVFCGIVFILVKSFTETNVYWGKVDVGEYYKNDVSAPLIIGGVYSPWLQTSLTPYFTDGRRIEFAFSMKEFAEAVNKYDEVYVIIGGEKMDTFSVPDNYQIVKDSIFDDNNVESIGDRYKIRRKIN